MTALVLISFFASFFFPLVIGDELPVARILLYKSTPTTPVVEGRKFQINYQIINSGEGTATKIEVMDRFDPNSFEILAEQKEDGTVHMSVDEVVPGGQANLNVTIIPKLYGTYESTRAKIRYYNDGLGDSEESGEGRIRTGYSTSLGRVRIVSNTEYSRATSYYLKDWGFYFGLVSVSTVVPLLLWWQTKTINEKTSKRKNL